MGDHHALDLASPEDPVGQDLADLLFACLDDFSPTAIQEHETGDRWRVFFRSARDRDDARAALMAAFGARLSSIAAVDVPDDGWARRSQAQLTAVQVGRIVVTPPWVTPPAAADVLPVVIEPSMGFGTGHHATTRLCLQLLQTVPLDGCRVIDVGTGSGVLAIAAWKLGAALVTAIDCDPDALQNARENIARNGAAGITTLEADLGALDALPADVVVANLTGAVLQRYGDTLSALVALEGRLIVSGFSPDELPAVETAFHRRASRSLEEAGWAAALFTAPAPTAA